TGPILAQENQRFTELKQAMDSAHVYDGLKMKRLQRIKDSIRPLPEGSPQKAARYQRLFDEYKIFKSDSAFQYALKMKELSITTRDTVLLQRSYINLADISIAVGMYKEGLDYLGQIDLKALSPGDRPMYHGLYGRCYGDMAEYSNLPSFSKLYNQYAREYREKAQPEVEEGSFYHRFMVAFNLYEAGQLDRAGEQLLGILAGGLDQRD